MRHGMAWQGMARQLNRASLYVKRYWEIIADNLNKAGWSWGHWLITGILGSEQSSLLMYIAGTLSASLCVQVNN
jgi:hypothetical protein